MDCLHHGDALEHVMEHRGDSKHPVLSVFVLPGILNTVTVIVLGTSGLDRNHSAAAQDSNTDFAFLFPAFAFASTS